MSQRLLDAVIDPMTRSQTITVDVRTPVAHMLAVCLHFQNLVNDLVRLNLASLPHLRQEAKRLPSEPVCTDLVQQTHPALHVPITRFPYLLLGATYLSYQENGLFPEKN